VVTVATGNVASDRPALAVADPTKDPTKDPKNEASPKPGEGESTSAAAANPAPLRRTASFTKGGATKSFAKVRSFSKKAKAKDKDKDPDSSNFDTWAEIERSSITVEDGKDLEDDAVDFCEAMTSTAATASTPARLGDFGVESPQPGRRSAYEFYVEKNRGRIRAAHPNITDGELAQMCETAWLDLDEKEEELYDGMAARDAASDGTKTASDPASNTAGGGDSGKKAVRFGSSPPSPTSEGSGSPPKKATKTAAKVKVQFGGVLPNEKGGSNAAGENPTPGDAGRAVTALGPAAIKGPLRGSLKKAIPAISSPESPHLDANGNVKEGWKKRTNRLKGTFRYEHAETGAASPWEANARFRVGQKRTDDLAKFAQMKKDALANKLEQEQQTQKEQSAAGEEAAAGDARVTATSPGAPFKIIKKEKPLGGTQIALDSGTGETKVIKFCQGTGGSVEVTEMAKLGSLKGLFAGTVDAAVVAELVGEIRAAVDAASPSHCFAGLTSWFRTADESEQTAVGDFFREHLPEFEVLKLSGHEEALKESIAVTYAAEKSGIGKPDTQVAAGGGSMQLVQGSEVYSLEQGFREGQAELMGTEPRAQVCAALEARAAQRFSEFKAANRMFAVTAGTIVGISAAYYAAKGAKVDCSKGVRASEAHALFEKRKGELVADCSAEEATSPVSDKKVAQEIANVIIFCELFEQLIHPDSEMFFRRNWELEGVPFITTWSAGHFLQQHPGIDLDDTPAVAKKEAEEVEAIQRLAKTELQELPMEARVERLHLLFSEAFLRDCFVHLDVDGSNSISLIEFLKLPVVGKNNAIFYELDSDHSGDLDVDEFVTGLQKLERDAALVKQLELWRAKIEGTKETQKSTERPAKESKDGPKDGSKDDSKDRSVGSTKEPLEASKLTPDRERRSGRRRGGKTQTRSLSSTDGKPRLRAAAAMASRPSSLSQSMAGILASPSPVPKELSPDWTERENGWSTHWPKDVLFDPRFNEDVGASDNIKQEIQKIGPF
jgi:hypothetical protein